jgi:hypothetical protein
MLIAAQIVLAVFLVVFDLYRGVDVWYRLGDGAPRSPLRGIWIVDTMSIDGELRPPLTTDLDRWRRVIFDRTTVAFQLMDDTFTPYRSTLDLPSHALTATTTRPPAGIATHFTVQHPTTDRLTLDGTMNGHVLHAEMHLMQDFSKFWLITRGFHLIQSGVFQR